MTGIFAGKKSGFGFLLDQDFAFDIIFNSISLKGSKNL